MLRILGLLGAALIALGIVAAAHGYLFQRLVLDAGIEGPARSALLVMISMLGLTILLQPIAERTLRPPLSRVVSWPASLWMGLFFYLFILTALGDGLAFVFGESSAFATEDVASAAGGEPIRAALVVAVSLAIVAVALKNGMAPPADKRVEIVLSDWPVSLDGFRIAQISDIHIGPILDRRFARELTERVNEMDADLVAVTGDLVDGRVSCLREEVAPFGALRGRHGVFFVTGNHDHYSGAESWSDEVGSLGMTVLRNSHRLIEVGDEGFALVGVDDHRARLLPDEGGEDLERALDGVDPAMPIVLLAHDPSTFKKAASHPVALQISGHTHGGQIWPFSLLVRLAVPFVAGIYRRGGSALYVSRGTGFWGPPMRFRAPAEITELVLRSGARSV